MEKAKITNVDHFHGDDFDELNIRVNDNAVRNVVAEIADDDHNAFLQLDPETNTVIGATILYADDWFAEIANAFQNKDTNNPDVRFFLEQKINGWILERHSRLQTEPTIV